jgi:adenine-specific DNA-methyltransferase
MALTPHHAKYFARQAPTLEQKLAGQKQIRALESQRNAKRKSLFEAQDAVDQRREALINQIEAKLTQNATAQAVMSFRWRLE